MKKPTKATKDKPFQFQFNKDIKVNRGLDDGLDELNEDTSSNDSRDSVSDQITELRQSIP